MVKGEIQPVYLCKLSVYWCSDKVDRVYTLFIDVIYNYLFDANDLQHSLTRG